MGFFRGERDSKMKKVFIVLVVLGLVLLPTFCLAGGSFTGNFRISMTIPAIIGVNVPDPNAPKPPLILAENVVSSMETQLTEMMVVRENQNIHLQTLVVR